MCSMFQQHNGVGKNEDLWRAWVSVVITGWLVGSLLLQPLFHSIDAFIGIPIAGLYLIRKKLEIT